MPEYKSTAGQRSFEYPAVSLWDSLPNSIIDIDNLQTFKIKLLDYFLERFLNS